MFVSSELKLSEQIIPHPVSTSNIKSIENFTSFCGGIYYGGINPSSLIKPKFTGFSNHSERDYWHHNIIANTSRLAWHEFPISSLPPNTCLHPVLLNHCLKTPRQIPWTNGQTVPAQVQILFEKSGQISALGLNWTMLPLHKRQF